MVYFTNYPSSLFSGETNRRSWTRLLRRYSRQSRATSEFLQTCRLGMLCALKAWREHVEKARAPKGSGHMCKTLRDIVIEVLDEDIKKLRYRVNWLSR